MSYELMHGDCLELIDEIEEKSIDVILTDPPYLYLNHRLDRRFNEDELFDKWERVLKDEGFIVIFGRGESFYRWNTKLSERGFKFKEEIIWNKRYSTSPVLPISRMHETISLWSKKGKIRKVKVPYLEIKQHQLDRMQNDLKLIVSGLGNNKKFDDMKLFLETGDVKMTKNLKHMSKFGTTVNKSFKERYRPTACLSSIVNGMNEQSIIEIKRDPRSQIKHPTQKPVRLIERLLHLCSKEEDTVLDCFMGSGSTGVACLNTNREFIGIEIDDEYFDIASTRLRTDAID